MTQEASHQTPLIVNIEMKNLVFYLTDLLENWEVDEDKEERDTGDLKSTIKPSHKEDPTMILTTKVNSVHDSNYNQFVCSTQFDIEEPETYIRVIQGFHTAQWAKSIEEKLDQLHKNKKWVLVPASKIEAGHQSLRRK